MIPFSFFTLSIMADIPAYLFFTVAMIIRL